MIRSLSVLVAGVLWFIGCGTSEPTVATIGRSSVTVREFEGAFAQKRGGWAPAATAPAEDRRRFLDQLIESRLRVLEAERLGLERDSAVVAELAIREQTLATSVLVEQEVVEPGVRRLIDRSRVMNRVAHVLLELSRGAAPADTLRVWDRAMAVIALADSIPFDSLARTYSEDKDAATNGGDLGFVRVGQLVPEFEDACYGMQPGEISRTPVRTVFGYHIVKLVDRLSDRGPMHVSNLMLPAASIRDKARVDDTLRVIYERYRAGTPFEKLFLEYSRGRDPMDSTGEIGEFNLDQLPPDVATLLHGTPVDSLSAPYRSPRSVHVFRVNAVRGISNPVEHERSLRQLYQRSRFLSDYAAYIRRLKSTYGFVAETGLIPGIVAAVDSTRSATDGQWRSGMGPALAKRVFVTMEERSWTVEEILALAEQTPEFALLPLSAANLRVIVERLGERLVLEEHARHVSSYRDVLNARRREHRDQVLALRLEQVREQPSILPSDSALRAFFDTHRSSFVWPAEVNIAEISVTSEPLLHTATKRLRDGEDFLSVAESLTMRKGYRERRGVWGWKPASESELTSIALTMAVDSVSGPLWNGLGYSLIKVLGKKDPRPKTFEEAQPELTPAYIAFVERQREAAWIDSLRSRFGVRIDDDALQKSFSGPRPD